MTDIRALTMSYRGKECAERLTIRSLQLLDCNITFSNPVVEVDVLLPSGRPSLLRFNVGERGILFQVFVPRAHLVSG